jgi:hypothetical protein
MIGGNSMCCNVQMTALRSGLYPENPVYPVHPVSLPIISSPRESEILLQLGKAFLKQSPGLFFASFVYFVVALLQV